MSPIMLNGEVISQLLMAQHWSLPARIPMKDCVEAEASPVKLVAIGRIIHQSAVSLNYVYL